MRPKRNLRETMKERVHWPGFDIDSEGQQPSAITDYDDTWVEVEMPTSNDKSPSLAGVLVEKLKAVEMENARLRDRVELLASLENERSSTPVFEVRSDRVRKPVVLIQERWRASRSTQGQASWHEAESLMQAVIKLKEKHPALTARQVRARGAGTSAIGRRRSF